MKTKASTRAARAVATVTASILTGVVSIATAATITFIGNEDGVDPTYRTQRWSGSWEPKTFDIGGEKYGTAGYYSIRPVIGTPGWDGVGANNDLGISFPDSPTLYVKPAFLAANPLGGAGTIGYLNGFSTFLLPDGVNAAGQGLLSLTMTPAGGTGPGGVSTDCAQAFSFTLSQAARFRLGVAVDTAGDGLYSADWVAVSNVTAGTVWSAQLTRDGVPDMPLFDIEGASGDQFTVSMHQTAGTGGSVSVFALITFDLTKVVYAGAETGGSGTGYTVENWSNAGQPKTFDVGGTDKFGTAGFYQFRPSDGTAIYEGVGDGNDLGITAGAWPTLCSTPAFLTANPAGGAGTYVNFGGYPSFRGPDGASLFQQGGLSLTLSYSGTAPSGAGNYANGLSFSLKDSVKTAHFRLGLAVDTVGVGTYAPNYVAISNTVAGTVFSAALSRDGVCDMVFFDIYGTGGESYVASLWQTVGAGPAAFGLVTFDLIEPVVYASKGTMVLVY